MMLPSFLMSPSLRRVYAERQRHEVERRLETVVPWSQDIRWVPELNIQAKTYKTFSLFDVPAFKGHDPNDAELKHTVLSPKKNFCYIEKRLKRGDMLQTMYGHKKGTVTFDGPIIIPCLHDRGVFGGTRWEISPWMSLTPMEVMTLRPGTRRAKGRVIVAGLGLGYQLIEVSKRPQVKELVLVEKSQELVDWLLPRITPMLHRKLDDVVVGDAYKKLPKMRADIALIDIFRSYGFNKFEKLQPVSATRNAYVPVECPRIKSIWCWGGAQLRD